MIDRPVWGNISGKMNNIPAIKPDSGSQSWFGSGRKVLIVVAVVAIVLGLPVFWTPSREASYSFSSMGIAPAGDSGAIRFYRCEVGNTGLKPLEGVEVAFSRSVIDRLVIQPYAKRFGFTDLAIEGRAEGDAVVYQLGPIEPGVRIVVNFSLTCDKGEIPPPDKEVLKFVRVAKGKAREGDPSVISLFRILYRILLNVVP